MTSSGLSDDVTAALPAVSATVTLPETVSSAPATAPDEAPLPGAGTRAELDMGTNRVNWTHAKWVVIPFGSTRDLSEFGGVRVVVTTDRPREDAGVPAGPNLKCTFLAPGTPVLTGAITAKGGDEYYAVVTVQNGSAPTVSTEGDGLGARATVGKQTVHFDGKNIVLGK